MTYLAEEISKQPSLASKLKSIKAVAFDVDGVLTGGQLFYSPEGEALKQFNVRDGVGIKLLNEHGIKVFVISAKKSGMVVKRMADLGVTQFFGDVKDKAQTLVSLLSSESLDPENILYVGDDVVDLPAMAESGLTCCPNDAYPLVKSHVDYIVPLAGGQGIARYVCDLILTAQGKYEEAYRLAQTAYFERKRSDNSV